MPSQSDFFGAATRGWLAGRFPAPTEVQARGWPLLASGRHALLIAPTGSGKTLAAFLAAIDRLGRRPADAARGVRVLYVSPLKALVADIERNLRAPIEGIAALDPAFRAPRVALRTGDSSPRDRRVQARDPAEILVTTPESLYLILGSKARETLASVETIIVDEIHALAGSKRGVHLALSLERVARRCRAGDPQRIGLSATARPVGEIARFLGGDRAVEIVDASARPALALEVRVPVPDMTRLEAPATSLWSAIEPELLAAIRAHRSTIVFTNSRALCERLAQALNDLAGEPLVRAHHGSVAQDERREIERALAAGELRGIVATSSLELGIDMAAVELVLLVESPGAVARGLQRIGRAGHAVGETSRGIVYPKHRGDLLEAAVVARGMRAGEVEAIAVPRGALDVLAQQIVAIAAEEPTTVADLEASIRRTACYAELEPRLFVAVLDMLSGKYPSAEFAELRPRIRWDRSSGRIEARDGAGRVALLSGGTIPDRGQYAVHVGEGGPRIGELDEEMVHETKPGDVIVLGASSWRTLEIGRDRVLVAPAPGEPGRLPFWRGDGPGRPIELGRALGRFVRELDEAADPEALLREEGLLDAHAIRNLVDHLAAQRAATGGVPHDRTLVIERFRDELGDLRIAIHSPFGARVHAPWALAIAENLRGQGLADAHPLWTDDGILLRLPDMDRRLETTLLLPDAEAVEELVCAGLEDSALFAAQFRENAARALLLPRRYARARTPLWAQRLRAQNLHGIARGFPDFPIMLETYRSCLVDVFDLASLVGLLRDIEAGAIAVRDVETSSPSPCARSLVFAYTAAFLYQGDMPAAERKSQALVLDRTMLRELLGASDLRALLDPRAIDEVEATLQRVGPEWRVANADGLHDRLRELGALSDGELARRSVVDLAALVAARRIVPITLAGENCFIAAEDAALYRDALGIESSTALPEALLTPAHAPLEQLVLRHARTHASFTTADLAARLGLRAESLAPLLDSLARRGRLFAGAFDPRRREPEWCDPEVLRRIKKRTLARLREEIEPVAPEAHAAFLLDWQGVAAAGRGESALEAAIDPLAGLPLSFAELERAILPARVPDYQPGMLDRLGSEGRIVWIGHGAIGDSDLRVALYRRDQLGLLVGGGVGGASVAAGALEPPALETRIEEFLAQAGASFFADLVAGFPLESPAALARSLWSLVARGAVTNDTFAPLRASRVGFAESAESAENPAIGAAGRGRRDRRPRSQRRPGRHAPPDATAGRWSLVARLSSAASASPTPTPTARLHARTLALLARHGIVSRESLAIEEEPGGFAAIYPVLRELEEAGRVRRGRFSAGVSSAQFALPGAVDRLRRARSRASGSGRAVWLASQDPAQPYGGALPWPPTGGGRPRRAVGTSVVLVDGRPILFVERGGRMVFVFEAERRAGSFDEDLLLALQTLAANVKRLAVRRLAILRVDGEPALGSIHAPLFVRAGFRASERGFELDRLATGDASRRTGASRSTGR